MVALGKSRERAAAGAFACTQLPAGCSRILFFFFFFLFCVAACLCYYSLPPLFFSCCFSSPSSPFSASVSLPLCLAAAALSLREQRIDSEQSLRQAALPRAAAHYRKALAAAIFLPGSIFAGHLASRSSLIATAAAAAAAPAASHRRRSRGAAADTLTAAASAAAQRTSLRAASPAKRQLRVTIPFVAASLELWCLLLHSAGAPAAAAAAGTGCRAEPAAAADAAVRLCVLHTEAPAAAAAVLSGTPTHLTPHIAAAAAAAAGRGPQRSCAAGAAAVGDTPLSTTFSALRSAAVAALRAATRSGCYTFNSNSRRPSSSLLTRRRRLLCFPAAAPLLRRSLSDATAAAATSHEQAQEVCVSQPAARGEIATRHSSTSLCLPHSGGYRRRLCGGERRGTGKLTRRKVLLFPFPRDGCGCFISFCHTPEHSSTSTGSTCAAVTHFRLTAAAAAARALLKCKETRRGAAPSCRLQQPCRYCSRRWCCTSLYLNSTYPPPSAYQSPFRAFSSARPRSQPHHTPPLPRCGRYASFKLSNLHYLTLPATYTRASRLAAGRSPGSCLLRNTRNVAGTASLLADTLASHLHSKYVAVSRLLRTGTTSGADWLVRQFRRSFVGVDRPRIFAECTKIVNIACQSIHRQLLAPITWRFANTVQDVATHFTSLFTASRVFALLAGEARSFWIAAAMEAAAECAAAAAAFWGTCAASMLLQKNIGVSCAAKTCKLFGVATVFAASNAATGAASTLRYIVEALHSRREAGRAETTQLQLLSSRQVHTDTADVQPLRDTAGDQLHKTISAASQQQMSPTTRLHSSAGVTGAEATGPAQELHHASPFVQQQQRALLADSSLQQGVERRQEQPDATRRGGVAEDSLDRLHTPGAEVNYDFLPSSLMDILRACGGSPEALHACVKEGVLGCVVFWLLGGRFFRLSPSSLLAPGAYHQHHLSLRAGADYASLEERRFIKKLGETFGCHTCGRRRGVEEWVADHQPPKSVVVKFSQTWFGWMYGSLRRAFGGTRYLPQRFYPQCKTCSSKQAAVVKHNATRTRKADLIINWGSVRAYHLTGGVLQFLRLLAGS